MREERIVIGPLSRPVAFRLIVDNVHAKIVDERGFVVASIRLDDPDATKVIQMPTRPVERPAEPLRAVPASLALVAVVDGHTGAIRVPLPQSEADSMAEATGGLVVLLPIQSDYRQSSREGWSLGNRQGDPRMRGTWNSDR